MINKQDPDCSLLITQWSSMNKESTILLTGINKERKKWKSFKNKSLFLSTKT